MNIETTTLPDDEPSLENLDELATYLAGKFEGWRKDRQPWESQWRDAWDRYNLTYKPEQDETEGVGGRSHHSYGLARKKHKVFLAHVDDLLFNQGKFPFQIKNTPEEDFSLQDIQGNVERFSLPDVVNEQDRVGGMFLRMKDQLVEGKFRDEINAVLHQMGLFGAGAIEGPLVDVRTRSKYIPIPIPPELQVTDPNTGAIDPRSLLDNMEFELEQVEVPAPYFRQRDIWDVFPDLRSEDTDQGEGLFVVDVFTESEFAELAMDVDESGVEVYSREAIQHVLNSGASTSTAELDRGPHRQLHDDTTGDTKQRMIEVFTFHGRVMKKDVEEWIDFGGDEDGPTDENGERPVDDYLPIEVVITYSNGKVLRATASPHEKGRRLIKVVPCSRVPGSPFGWGIPKEADQADSMFNAYMRLMLDNKRQASYVDKILDRTRLENPDEVAHFGREYKVIPGASTDNVVQYLVTPDVSDNILSILEFCEQWGDAATGIPAFLEGADVQTSSQTAYEVSEQKSSSIKLLGLVMYMLDSRLLVPCLEDLYDWNMKHDNDNQIKGDFTIEAKGFQSFRDVTVRAVELRNILAMAQDPNSKAAKVIKVDNIIRELSKLAGVDAEEFILTEDEQKQQQAEEMAQFQQQQQAAMQAAMNERQMNDQSDMAKQEQKHGHDMEKESLKHNADITKQKQKEDSEEQRDLLREETKRGQSMLQHQERGAQLRGAT